MLTEVCAELRNYFVSDIHNGTFEIVGGKITSLDFIQENQYFRIVGSVFNDGVYKNTADLELTNEVFCGSVWAMAVPPSVVALAEEIKEHEERRKRLMEKFSGFSSESFGGYSYTIDESWKQPWQVEFASRLNKWRRISVL